MIEHSDADATLPIRQLGPLEELFWNYGRATPFHFSLAAELEGQIDVEVFRSALHVLRTSRPMLRLGIVRGSDGVLAFAAGTLEIPLRVVEESDARWQKEMAIEMAWPFDASDCPLFRAVLLPGPQRSTLILTTDHAIMDGIALAQLVRDLLQVMAGEHLDIQELSGPFEQLAGVPAVMWMKRGTTTRGAERVASSGTLRVTGTVPQISNLRLSPELTFALVRESHFNGTSVQGALCAALIIAGRGYSGAWKESTVRLLSPMNLRPLIGLANEPVLAIVVPVLHAQPANDNDFWGAARALKAELRQYEIPETLGVLGQAVVDRAHRGLDPVSAAEFMIEHFTSEGMVSNIGVQNFDLNGTAPELKGLWGPTLLTGIEDEQVIGAVTVAGALHLTHTSMRPFPGLLQTIANLIEQHVGGKIARV